MTEKNITHGAIYNSVVDYFSVSAHASVTLTQGFLVILLQSWKGLNCLISCGTSAYLPIYVTLALWDDIIEDLTLKLNFLCHFLDSDINKHSTAFFVKWEKVIYGTQHSYGKYIFRMIGVNLRAWSPFLGGLR